MTAEIKGYDWAQNRSKLERAITELTEKGEELTDESVKAVYRRLLGFVIGEDDARPVSKEMAGLTSEQLYKMAKDKAKLEGKDEKKVEEKIEEKPKTKKK